MKYKTSDLSNILNVSSNTIRRFEEKGYLSSNRDDENKYRYFRNSDIEKITYISKYRKIGLSHDEIASILQSDIKRNIEIHQRKMDEIDLEISRLTSLRHMLKDDIKMMRGIEEYGDEFIEMDTTSVYYFCYKIDKKIKSSIESRQIAQRFLYDFTEIEYVYIIRKEDMLKRTLKYEEAIAIRSKLAEQLNLDMSNKEIEYYPKCKCIVRAVKIPIDFGDNDANEREEIKRILYDDFFEYMEKKGYVLAGNALGVKIGYSKEENREMQYLYFNVPVKEKE